MKVWRLCRSIGLPAIQRSCLSWVPPTRVLAPPATNTTPTSRGVARSLVPPDDDVTRKVAETAPRSCGRRQPRHHARASALHARPETHAAFPCSPLQPLVAPPGRQVAL